jgi:hypothetical protein
MITEWNETVATITGRKKAEVTGWHFASNFIPEGHRASMQARPPAVLPTIVPVYRRRRHHPHGLRVQCVRVRRGMQTLFEEALKGNVTSDYELTMQVGSGRVGSVSSRIAALTSHAPLRQHAPSHGSSAHAEASSLVR